MPKTYVEFAPGGTVKLVAVRIASYTASVGPQGQFALEVVAAGTGVNGEHVDLGGKAQARFTDEAELFARCPKLAAAAPDIIAEIMQMMVEDGHCPVVPPDVTEAWAKAQAQASAPGPAAEPVVQG